MRTVNADILIDCIKLMKPILSFESIVSDDMTLETTLADKTVDVELEVDRLLLRGKVSDILKPYKLWERQVIILLYGLDGRSPMTKREVSKASGHSFQYVAATEKKVLARLRNNMILKSYYECMGV
jgi:DNA-directed RNA polymerase sigma subunit (sigma70/sigma32)